MRARTAAAALAAATAAALSTTVPAQANHAPRDQWVQELVDRFDEESSQRQGNRSGNDETYRMCGTTRQLGQAPAASTQPSSESGEATSCENTINGNGQ